MNREKLELLCHQTCKTVEAVGAFIRQELGKVRSEQITDKALNSLVSYVDRTAEERLVSALSDLLPGSVFLTEEATVVQQSGEYQWIIDPLDGTTNFLHSVPYFAVSVALRENERTILGIVYEVNRAENFYGWEGGGAWLNGQPIRSSATAALKDSLIATGFPYRDYDKMRPYFIALEAFMKKTRGLRRFGAAAVDLAYVAAGRFDAFFEYGLSSWDVAAGAFLVELAGGKVSDFKGGSDYLFNGDMIASGQHLYEPVFEVVQRAFSPV